MSDLTGAKNERADNAFKTFKKHKDMVNTHVDSIVDLIISDSMIAETGMCPECGVCARGLVAKNIKMMYDYEILFEQLESLKKFGQ